MACPKRAILGDRPRTPEPISYRPASTCAEQRQPAPICTRPKPTERRGSRSGAIEHRPPPIPHLEGQSTWRVSFGSIFSTIGRV
jgi:hypothetical protein